MQRRGKHSGIIFNLLCNTCIIQHGNVQHEDAPVGAAHVLKLHNEL